MKGIPYALSDRPQRDLCSNQAGAHCDVLLALGTSFGRPLDQRLDRRHYIRYEVTKLIQADIDARELGKNYLTNWASLRI